MMHERATSSRLRRRIWEGLYSEAAVLAKHMHAPISDVVTFLLADAMLRARQRRLARERADGRRGAACRPV